MMEELKNIYCTTPGHDPASSVILSTMKVTSLKRRVLRRFLVRLLRFSESILNGFKKLLLRRGHSVVQAY